MRVTVRLFAVLRQRAGTGSLELELSEGATVADALRRLAERDELQELIERMPLRVAVNREYAPDGSVLAPGDELAVIPPVSGGAGPHARVTDEPLSLDRLVALVSSPGAGATVTFTGTTRDVGALDYEAYREMAEERIAAILTGCVERHGLQAAAAEHRMGRVPLSEPSVIVAVSAAHRAEAFAAAREAIDRIKEEAPIWKTEVSEAAELSHLDGTGVARMVDVAEKPVTDRIARAEAELRMAPETARAIARGDSKKGDVLGTARLAAIQAAKRTDELIPLAHTLPLTRVDVEFALEPERGRLRVISSARAAGRTGVEMEAMTAAAVAALTVYDMVKGIERGVEIVAVRLLAKSGGRHDWAREEPAGHEPAHRHP
jgi:molybdenum cofactor biosynthesis protein MoaC/molybdopterin converting factor subunit 1